MERRRHDSCSPRGGNAKSYCRTTICGEEKTKKSGFLTEPRSEPPTRRAVVSPALRSVWEVFSFFVCSGYGVYFSSFLAWCVFLPPAVEHLAITSLSPYNGSSSCEKSLFRIPQNFRNRKSELQKRGGFWFICASSWYTAYLHPNSVGALPNPSKPTNNSAKLAKL